MRIFNLAAAIFFSVSLSSCLLDVENQIIPDDTYDKRLIGVWTCIPLHDTEEAEAAASEEDSHRNDDDIGINGYVIFGDTRKDSMEILAIEKFDARHGTSTMEFRNAKTRKHGDRNYLLFHMQAEEDIEDKNAEKANFVMEYAIQEDGTLRLWYFDMELLEDAHKIHPIKQRKQDSESREASMFSAKTITATPEETLAFYSDPKVAAMMVSAGRYKKLPIPKNARVAWDPNSEDE